MNLVQIERERTQKVMEVLAMYQLYGLEIEYEHEVRIASLLYRKQKDRGILIGLSRDMTSEDECLQDMVSISLHADRNKWLHVLPAFIKPILRPWEDLLKELPNGDVPALIVAKMLWNLTDEQFKQLTSSVTANNSIIAMHTAGGYQSRITNTWEFYQMEYGLIKASNRAVEIVDYLRRNHFALPVNGRQLVEGVDYIRKEIISSEPVTISSAKA